MQKKIIIQTLKFFLGYKFEMNDVVWIESFWTNSKLIYQLEYFETKMACRGGGKHPFICKLKRTLEDNVKCSFNLIKTNSLN